MVSKLRGLVIATAVVLLSAVTQAHSYRVDTVVDSDPAVRNSISVGRDSIGLAYDSMGNLGMCYHDDTNDDLKFALHDGNRWAHETAHADRDRDVVGTNCAIIFDDDDNPHLFYHNETDRSLLHAFRRDGRWTISTVDALVGQAFFGASRISVAKNRMGFIFVAYYDAINRDLKYARMAGDRWQTSTVVSQGDVGRYPSLDFDADNNPAITYQAYTDDTHSTLNLVRYRDNAWQAPEVVDRRHASGFFSALKFDTNGKPHIAYRHYNTEERSYMVYYVNKVGEDWSEPYDLAREQGPATGQFLQMAIDDSNNVHIIYMDQFLSALFPDVNYLQVANLIFADRGLDFIASQRQFVAASVVPQLDYAGLAIAIDSDYHLTVAWAQENGRLYNLMTAKLTEWTPSMVLLTPNDISHSGQNSFEMQWIDFDPDSNAHIRFGRRDANFNVTYFDEQVRENDANNLSVNLANVPRGDYWVVAEIADNPEFNMASSISPRVQLTVQNHLPGVPVLASPADQGNVDSATPALQWGAVNDVDADPVTYAVQIASDDGFANVVASGNTNNTQFVPGANLRDGTTYYWRVRALDADGNSDWAANRRFAVALPAAPIQQAPVAAAPAQQAQQQAPAGGNQQQAGGNNAGMPIAGNAPVAAGGGGAAAGAQSGSAGASAGGGGGSAVPSASGGSGGGGCSLIRP